MKLQKIICFLVVIFLANAKVHGQDITMANGTISQCGGIFYDSGGDTIAYSPNENYVYTICADQPGKCVSLSFTSFSLENGFDFLYVFNGPTTSSPLLGTFTGSTLPGTVTATSGCLTVKFVSDYTVCKAGWKALMSCGQCPVNGCPTCNGGSPPANDACSGAENLGALAIPAACPSGVGAISVFNKSNLCATAEIPYNALQGCKPVGSMAAPAADVWYMFTITAPILNVTINGMITPEVGLYSGTGCNNLVPRGCAIGGGGLLNTSFSGLAPGTYYLQVSGGTINDQCNFSLSLQNNNDCLGCVVQSGLTVSPPPVNGIYLSNQTVNFCLNITGFNPTSANWLHGVVPHFGAGWDLSSLVPLPPNSCSGNGDWSWYSNIVTSSSNGATAGPGFFYETSAGNTNNVVDIDPGNNFGDNISNGCNLNFCWRINTQPQNNCTDGQNLNVFIDTYADGESGSWTSTACTGDPVNDFYATLACCIPPAVVTTNAICNGQTGSAMGTGKGSGPWIFIWKNAAGTIIRQTVAINTPDQVINLAVGTYTLTTQDVNGCQSTTAFAITEPQPLSATLSTTSTKCGLNNGVIGVIASGGTAPYMYSKNNGTSFQSGSQFSGLAPGAYSIILKDVNGCTSSAQANIGTSTSPTIVSLTESNITCYGGTDGKIVVLGSSGIAPYTYEVTSGSFSVSQAATTFNNLGAGTYQVTLTDVNGCKADSSVILIQPPFVDLLSVPVPSDCNLNNGQIDLTVLSGSVGTLLYSIDAGLTFQTGNTFDSLSPGVYNVTVQDANGCLVKDTVIINTINAPVIDSIIKTNLTCYHSANGTISIYASDGVGTLDYSINNGATYSANSYYSSLTAKQYTIVIRDDNNCRVYSLANLNEPNLIIIKGTVSAATKCGLNNAIANLNPVNGVAPLEYSVDNGATWTFNSSFTGLPSGNLVILVRDANGCTGTRTYPITPSSPPQITSYNITDVLCYNSNSGAATINVANGTPPMQFSIDSGITYQSASFYSNMVAGSYYIKIKDAKNCVTDSTFIIQQPIKLNVISLSVNTTCSFPNGSITLNATGGIAPYLYSNDGGGVFGVNNVFNNLLPGNYKVVVKDANNCEEASTVTVIDEPGPRIIDLQSTPQICDGVANASIDITAVSGTGILQYSVDSGATYVTTPLIQNLYGGFHYVYVADVNGCYDSTVVDIDIHRSPQINDIAFADPLCFNASNGSIAIDASGGKGILMFSINNGSTFTNTSNFLSLGSGNYIVVVSDSNQCMAKDSVQLTEPSAISASYFVTPETCGSSNGELIIEVTGGIPTYFFSANNSAASVDSVFENLVGGNYAVAVTDVNGCYDSLNIVMVSLSQPAINSLVVSNSSCFGSDDGSVTVNATGHGNLTYSLDNIVYQPSNSFTNLTVGNYNIFIKDTNDCVTDTSFVITEPDEITATFIATDANCGQSNGSLTINAVGGTGILKYAFNGSPVFNVDTIYYNLISGNYTVTVKDNSNCSVDFTGSVSNINGATIQSVNFTDNKCNGDTLGEIIVTATGGTGPLSYSIDNGLTFQSANQFINLSANNYNIVVTDTVGCFASASQQISEPALLVLNSNSTPATCAQSNGSISLAAAGGIPQYNYSIDSINFQTSSVFNNLAVGTYTVYVTDSNLCAASKIVSVINLSAPVISNVSFQNVTCFGVNNGSISFSATGGTGNLQYSIDNGVNFQPSGVFDSVSTGVYHLVVKDNNDCADDTIITITTPTAINAAINVADANCNFSNGSIVVQSSGGTGTLLYQLNAGTFSAIDSFPSLFAGNYTITVKDSLGCKRNFNALVNTINGPVIDTVLTSNINCYNASTGTIQINVTSGSGTLAYSINNGNSFNSNNIFNQLHSGNYSIKVKDTVGCVSSSNVVLTEPSAITINQALVNPACGQGNGSITLNVGGGTGSLLTSIDSITFTPITNYVNLFAGSYTIYVKDANNCVSQKAVSLSNLLAPKINALVSKNLKCNNSPLGEIKVLAAGGTGLLTYSINNGVSYQSLNVFDTLAAGLYQVSVVDANGCKSDTTVAITEPLPLLLSPFITPEICSNNNGKFSLSSAGGISPYLFSVDSGFTFTSNFNYLNKNEGSYHVAVKDANGCKTFGNVNIVDLKGPKIINHSITNVTCYNLNNGIASLNIDGGNGQLTFGIASLALTQTDSLFTGLAKGNYVLVVTDTNNCSDQIPVTITQPSQLVASKNITNPSCFGFNNGTIAVTSTGGSSPYTISWNSGANSFSIDNLVAGTYVYTVTDQQMCNVSDSVVLTQPNALSISHQASNGSCAGSANAAASIAVTGGTLPFSYQWYPNTSNTNYANGLAAGNYTVTVTDGKGCTLSHGISITNPSPIVTTVAKNNVSCFGAENGSLSLAPVGGFAPYTYYWSTGDTAQTIDSIPVGIYSVIITDNSGCTVETSDTVTSPAIISFSGSITNVTCNGDATGYLSVQVSGGVSPYTYLWSNNSITPSNSSITAGSYLVTITDANKCTRQAGFTVNQPTPVEISVTANDTLCIGQQTTLYSNASGGNGNYTYLWNTGATTNLLQTAPALSTMYFAIATDSSGCSSIADTAFVFVFPPLDIQLTGADTVCAGQTISLEANANGGNGGPYNYNWLNIGTNPQVTINADSTVFLIATATDNCTVIPAVDSIQVTVNPLPEFNFNPVLAEGCMPLNVEFINNSNITGTTWYWNFGDLSLIDSTAAPTHLYEQSGTFDVFVTAITEEQCVDSILMTDAVHVFPLPTADFSVSPESTTILHPIIDITDNSQLGYQWYYDFGDGKFSDATQPSHVYADTGTFTIMQIVSTEHQCVDTTYREIIVKGAFTLYIPNAFTPNNDGVNDNFFAQGYGIVDMKMLIFNRWGNPVFEGSSLSSKWNGRRYNSGDESPQGVYVYKIKVKDMYGQFHSYDGRVTLLK